MNTQDKADDYNERAKKQIRTKALQKGQEMAEQEAQETIKALKKEIKELKKENKELKAKLGIKS